MLLEHVVGGRPWMPAAGWVVMAVDALCRALPGAAGAGVLLSELRFEQALALAGPVSVQTVLTREVSGWSLDLRQRAGDAPGWQRCVHVAAADRPAEAPLPFGGFDLPAGDDEGWTAVDEGDLYARLRAAGLDHGPSFRALHGLRRRRGVAQGRLHRLPAGTGPLPAPWLDAVLHAAAVLLDDERPDDKRCEHGGVQGGLQPAHGVPVPVAIARLWWDGRPAVDGLVVQARLCERHARHAVAQLQVLHADGTCGLQVDGLRVQWMGLPASQQAAAADPREDGAPAAGLAPRSAGPDQPPLPDLPPLPHLLALAPDAALAALRQGLAALLREVLQLGAAGLPAADAEAFAQVRLSSLGVDSLAAMDLRERLRRWLGAELPARDFVSGTPLGVVLAQLHEHLLLLQLSQPANPVGDAELETVVL